MNPVVRNHVIVVAAVVAVVVVTIVLGRSEDVGWAAAIALMAGHVAVAIAVLWGVARRRRNRSAE